MIPSQCWACPAGAGGHRLGREPDPRRRFETMACWLGQCGQCAHCKFKFGWQEYSVSDSGYRSLELELRTPLTEWRPKVMQKIGRLGP